jgi:asparagine synthase (glutamine-hydrolysing)
MCGVGGVYLPGAAILGDEHRSMLAIMADEMAARGPDAEGTRCEGRVGLVHRRLSIIDPEERSNQPMESADWILSYNGEIYNFKDIRRDLERKHEFKTRCDSEVLLLALQEWGLAGALERCAGMFAFLAFDKRDGTLHAARDRMGIKPLLMSTTEDGGFCFASSVTAIRRSMPNRRWKTFKPALGSYFALGAPFTRSSAIEGIERVEPAHYVTCRPDGSFTTTRYWTPRYRPDFTMEEMLAIISEYSIADVPSALFLSGGVDSTFLCAATENLDCFHLSSPETTQARQVAKRFDRRFVLVEPDHREFQSDVENVIAFHGEPLMSCGIPAAVSRSVRESGYKMAISANGADELLHGYYRTPTPGFSPDYLPLHETPSFPFFSKQLAHIFRDARNFEVPELKGFIPSLQEIGNDAIAKFHLPGFSASAHHRWFELMTYVLHDLNPTLDAASMAYGLEMRVPFLDHRIVEGVLSWDANQLITPTLGRKAPLKTYLEGFLPVSFFHRPKLGFSIHGPAMNKVSAIFDAALKKYKRSGRLKLTGKPNTGEYDRDLALMGSICFSHEIWCRDADGS